MAPMTRSSGPFVGRSLSECTAKSMRFSRSAASSSSVKKPFSSLPCSFERWSTSPRVVMVWTVTSPPSSETT
jgi:hypothetical protein